jgi:hypothetical protein
MPLPLLGVIFEIIELIGAALAAYEALDTIKELYEGLEQYNKGIDAAKKEIEEVIRKLEKEIEEKIAEKGEVAFLLELSAGDPQNKLTKAGAGRGADNGLISAAIKQKIPFRHVISLVCDKANAIPVLQLRKKKGVTVKDLPTTRRKALEEIVKLTLEEVADVELDNFIVVRLKQFAASLIFEFVDYCLSWASPMKCEVSFGPGPDYTDHPIQGGTATRLLRVGKASPFYPAPPPNNRKGSISADLVITDYRKKPCDKSNIFAIVEIKFEGDKIDTRQFEQYVKVLERAAKVKTTASPIRFENKAVSSGGRLALFRFPEDKPAEKEEHEKKAKKPGTRRKK